MGIEDGVLECEESRGRGTVRKKHWNFKNYTNNNASSSIINAWKASEL